MEDLRIHDIIKTNDLQHYKLQLFRPLKNLRENRLHLLEEKDIYVNKILASSLLTP